MFANTPTAPVFVNFKVPEFKILLAVVSLRASPIFSVDIVPVFVNLALAPFIYAPIDLYSTPALGRFFAVIVPVFSPSELSSTFIPIASP